jgi:hypothetical protein
MKTKRRLYGLLILLAALDWACGAPEAQVSDSLQVVYLPLDGAIQVDASVLPMAFFSEALDETSITANNINLTSAATCTAETFEKVSIDPKRGTDPAFAGNAYKQFVKFKDEAQAKRAVVIVPGSINDNPRTPLAKNMCYHLTFSTRIKGESIGSLLPLPDQPEIGAEIYFSTVPN